jgi:hypothetical protein
MYFLTIFKYCTVGEPVVVTGNAHLILEMTQYDLCSIIMEEQPSDQILNASVCSLCYFKAQPFCVIYCMFHIVIFTVLWPNFCAHSYVLEFNYFIFRSIRRTVFFPLEIKKKNNLLEENRIVTYQN